MNKPIFTYQDAGLKTCFVIEDEQDLHLISLIVARAAKALERSKTIEWLQKPLSL